MVVGIDRLPDWAYTDEELDNMAIELLENRSLSGAKHIAIYHLQKDGVDTGITMILAVESISDGLHAINRIWGPYNMSAEVGEFTEIESQCAGHRLRALEIVLDKFKYEGRIRCPGSDKLYRYQKWFSEII